MINYSPQQFNCNNCGGHEKTESLDERMCVYCRHKSPVEAYDWKLYQVTYWNNWRMIFFGVY